MSKCTEGCLRRLCLPLLTPSKAGFYRETAEQAGHPDARGVRGSVSRAARKAAVFALRDEQRELLIHRQNRRTRGER